MIACHSTSVRQNFNCASKAAACQAHYFMCAILTRYTVCILTEMEWFCHCFLVAPHVQFDVGRWSWPHRDSERPPPPWCQGQRGGQVRHNAPGVGREAGSPGDSGGPAQSGRQCGRGRYGMYLVIILVWAARRGHLEIVEALLNQGINVDAAGMVRI